MKRFLTRKDLRMKRKQAIYAAISVIVVIALYLVLTRKEKPEPELPTVCVTPAQQQDVEIYGEYVGRIRAQQFVEVRARVEGFLEQMLFEEGTYVKRNQTLFVINQDKYRAKADKARAQLKKQQSARLNVTWTVPVRCMKRMQPARWTWTTPLLLMKLQ